MTEELNQINKICASLSNNLWHTVLDKEARIVKAHFS